MTLHQANTFIIFHYYQVQIKRTIKLKNYYEIQIKSIFDCEWRVTQITSFHIHLNHPSRPRRKHKLQWQVELERFELEERNIAAVELHKLGMNELWKLRQQKIPC